jgi:hypothetical protein
VKELNAKLVAVPVKIAEYQKRAAAIDDEKF